MAARTGADLGSEQAEGCLEPGVSGGKLGVADEVLHMLPCYLFHLPHISFLSSTTRLEPDG